MKHFKKLVILDNLLLPDDVWAFLRESSDQLLMFGDKPIHGKSSEPSPAENVPMVTGEYILSTFCEVSAEYSREQIETLVERIGDADAVISCWTNLPDEILSRTPNVKYIAFWTNAYAHRVNFKLCEVRGIHVDHVADYGTHAVSEYVFAALFNLNRNLTGLQKDMLRGTWTYEYLKTGKSTPQVENIPYNNLFGQSIGIVGLGSIGSRVALAASLGFGMKTNYFSRSRKRELEVLGLQYENLQDLVSEKDVVSLHLPAEVRTPLITRELMEAMRPGTVLVNTGSGRAIDESAALDLAEAGHLRLVLDVYEARPPRERLKKLAEKSGRHLFTYRAGWYTKDAITLKARILQEKIVAYLENVRQ